ncbi:DNA repair exonuclease SbcCD nuclease subunit [Tranquillimonas rosea]|uniref:DNA repair exonuclease SbcCD nuclease subunit n=1 Tax=Tranquillimonas rosea TaxID=641238 RepID=A0A1H9PHS3_9RHOB|nr:DNA repair exonuclease [Tranquillimonas rosea]SER47836.1 DNA repair exonuclease SbcCD nuclease subunit [Tranquillimonas rosea]
MTFRFIHSSDLHLGRRFANIPQPPDDNIRGRLMEARHGAIDRLARAARSHGATHVLLAGDTFDTPTPSAGVLRQALAAMAGAGDMQWWLLPGNHDNLRDAEPLWDAIRRDCPPNVHPVIEAMPVELDEGATLLPCPIAWRSAGRDASEALVTMPSDEGALRLGLAHGGVTDFTETGESIPPDRDRSARLDYLALGDWHGRMEVGPRVQYPGSPEQDRFKHGRRGVCLAVTMDGVGASPRVEEIETGEFLWTEAELALGPRQDAADALEALLPAEHPRDTLIRVRATGWSGLPEQADLRRAAERRGPQFGYFELVTAALGTHYEQADLDEIDRAGALRLAAEALLTEAEDVAQDSREREVAADALARLYAFVKEVAQ